MKKYSCLLFLTFISVLILSDKLFGQENEEQPESPWSFSVHSRYLSRVISYGVDLGNDRSAAAFGAGAEHVSGFSFGADALKLLGEDGAVDQWSLSGAYEVEVAEWMSMSAEFTHYQYSNDSLNILASLSNLLSLSADFDFGAVSTSLSYDAYLGSHAASYISFDVSSFYRAGDLSIVPLVQLTVMSQDVENRLLKNNQGSGKGQGMRSSSIISTTTVSGLSSVNMFVVLLYRISEGLSASLVPSFVYAPKSEVSPHASQFVWSAGLRYSF